MPTMKNLKTITPKVIKTEAEYETALEHISSLMDAAPDTPAEDELELWALLIEQYEKKHFPIDAPDPIEAIRFRMDQMHLRPADLVPVFRSKSKVSEVLNRKRPLSLAMIRNLHNMLGIPARVLLKESSLHPH
jgi:HTH-type transcriptional regulator/antitoxin HigA